MNIDSGCEVGKSLLFFKYFSDAFCSLKACWVVF